MEYLNDPTSLFILCVIHCLTVSVYQTIRWKFMVSHLDVDEYTFLFPVIFKLFTNYKFSLSAKYISLKVKYNYTRCVFLSWVRNECVEVMFSSWFASWVNIMLRYHKSKTISNVQEMVGPSHMCVIVLVVRGVNKIHFHLHYIIFYILYFIYYVLYIIFLL